MSSQFVDDMVTFAAWARRWIHEHPAAIWLTTVITLLLILFFN